MIVRYYSTSLLLTIQDHDDYTDQLNGTIKGLKIGVPKELMAEGTDERIAKAVWKAIHLLEELGASFGETSLPNIEYALPAYYLIAMSEASSNLAR